MAVNLGARPGPILQPRRIEIEEAGGARSSRRWIPHRSRAALLLPLVAVGLLLTLRPATEMAHPVPPATTAVAARGLHAGAREVLAPARSPVPSLITGEAPGERESRIWVVARGETLWSIAHEVAPDRDPRSVVEALRRVNRLESAALRVGQSLQIPPELYDR